jgi:CDP-diacylglycerol---serine O-phosphatidyltransferase
VQDNRLNLGDSWLAWTMFTITIYAGCSMVSNAPFYSGKSFALTRSVPFWVMLLVVLVFVFVSTDPPIVLFGLFILYGLSGWAVWGWRVRKAKLSGFRSGSEG